MRTFRIISPVPSRFGQFVPHNELRQTSLCAACRGRKFERIFPAEIEYLGGHVADFHMAGIVMIAKRVVAEDLAARFAGIAVENILIYQGESLWSDPPRRKLMAKSYKGPELAELHFPLNIESDPALSTLVEVDRCDACGILSYDVKGVEKILGENEPRELFKGDLNYNRSPWMGLRVRAADLNGAMAYRYGGGRAQVLEPVKNYIEERGWTNVEFVDYGAIT